MFSASKLANFASNLIINIQEKKALKLFAGLESLPYPESKIIDLKQEFEAIKQNASELIKFVNHLEEQLHDAEFKDFIGDTNIVVPARLDDLESLLKEFHNSGLSAIPVEKITSFAYHGFKERKINRQQAATLLEKLAVQDCFDNATVTVLPLFPETTDPAIQQELDFFLTDLPEEKNQSKLKTLLGHITRHSEYALIKVIADAPLNDKTQEPIKTLDEDPVHAFFIRHKVVNATLTETGKIIYIIPSVSMRDGLRQMRYGPHAKRLLPRIGSLFTDQQIAAGVKSHSRYSATYFRSLERTVTFHGYTRPFPLLTWHDETHRKMMCSIPNPAYDAYLAAIELVIKQTGVTPPEESPHDAESKEILNAYDFDVQHFAFMGLSVKGLTAEECKSAHPAAVTEHFSHLLSLNMSSTDQPIGLFTQSPYVDTTWLLMLDLFFNPKKWQTLFIDPKYLFPVYKKMYDAVETYQGDVRGKPPAEQVAILKTRYLKTPMPEAKEIVFGLTVENYIQVFADQKPIVCSKTTYFYFEKLLATANPDYVTLLLSILEPITQQDTAKLMIEHVTWIIKYPWLSEKFCAADSDEAELESLKNILGHPYVEKILSSWDASQTKSFKQSARALLGQHLLNKSPLITNKVATLSIIQAPTSGINP